MPFSVLVAIGLLLSSCSGGVAVRYDFEGAAHFHTTDIDKSTFEEYR